MDTRSIKHILNRKILGFPAYGIAAGIGMFTLQRFLYCAADFFSSAMGFPYHTSKIPQIDDRIPVIPWFIVIYLLVYIFWIAGPIVVSSCSRRHFTGFMKGMLLSLLVGAFIFFIYPTRMDRVAENLLNQKPGIWNRILQFVYSFDGGQYGPDLMPSYHCLISTCCYMGVRKRPEVPKWYRIFSFLICFPIFASTVFCKQHYFLDILTGSGIAVICHLITQKEKQ